MFGGTNNKKNGATEIKWYQSLALQTIHRVYVP
jgi:hypothetical protein